MNEVKRGTGEDPFVHSEILPSAGNLKKTKRIQTDSEKMYKVWEECTKLKSAPERGTRHDKT